jgi:phosphoribosylformylglycinamidine cyclo-ligase
MAESLENPRREQKAANSDAYARAGVDVSAGNEAVARYRALLGEWRHPEQLDAIGGFAGLFRLPGERDRVLVASTDGVGTKVLIAAEVGRYGSVGIDLVNHCVNDILVCNATPLFFLDYLAVGKLEPAIAAEIVEGCARACREHDCALLGGETAELPGLYRRDHFDLAGTIVGLVATADIPDVESVVPGDAIVGLPSVGLHTNGYSLARSLMPREAWTELLSPHPSYYRAVRAIEEVATVKAMAHITGGGLLENVPRSLPESVKAIFEQERWEIPAIFQELIARGDLGAQERYRIFNMGIGYTLIVPLGDAAAAIAAVAGARIVGWIEARAPGESRIVIHPARDG